MRQVNALVVMKGKKKEEETRKGINGTRKRPVNMIALSVCLFIATIVPLYKRMENLKNKAYHLLKKSESLFKMDMVYIAKGGFWTSARFGIGLIASLATVTAFGNLLSKETYGTYSYLMSLAGSLSFLTLSGTGTGVIRAIARGKESVAPYALKLQLRYNLLATTAIGIAALYYVYKGNNVFAFSLLILAFALPFTAAYHIYESYLIGHKRFDTLTILTSISSLTGAMTTVAALFFTDNVILIVLVYAFTSFIPAVWMYKYSTAGITAEKPDDESLNELRRTSFHLTGAGIISTLAQYLDKIILFQVAGPASLAIYGFAIAGPEKMKGLIKNWSSIILPRLAGKSVEEIKTVFCKRIALALLVGMVSALFYILVSPLLFKIFLPKYIDSISYSQVYALGLIVIPALTFIGNIYYGLNMLRAVYLHSIGSQILRISLFVIFGLLWQAWGLIFASVISYLLSTIYAVIIWKIESRRILNKSQNA